MSLADLNWLDFVILAGVAASAVAGLNSGLARVVVGILASTMGLIAAFWCYRLAGGRLRTIIGDETAANVCGFAAIFLGALLLGAVASAVLSKIFQWVGLSWFNHLLGGFAGALRGMIVVAALLSMVVAFSPSPLPEALTKSRLLPYASVVTAQLVRLAPHEVKDAWDQQLQNLRQFWRRQSTTAPAVES